jgi:23S rRNA (uracil1939-C5)-methyltransferase
VTRKSLSRSRRAGVRHRPSRDASQEHAPEIWQIEKLIPGGDGMARPDQGQIGFAPSVIPGERLRVLASAKKKGFARATRFELIERSPERVEPPCRYAGRCGGCDWLHIEYSAQLRHKLELLRDALSRGGKIEPLPELSIEPSPHPLGYRNRIRVHVEQGQVGFRGVGSHDVVDVVSCAVAAHELDRALSLFRSVLAAQQSLPPSFEAELRVAPSDERALVRMSIQPGAKLLAALQNEFVVAFPNVPAPSVQRFPFASGSWLTVPAEAFVQVNWELNRVLVEALVQGARARGAARFLDLYAGAGNFSLPLLESGLSGVAVEGVGSAVRAAGRTIAELGLRGEVLTGDVGATVERLIQQRQTFDLVVLDPPRAGAPEVTGKLSGLKPRHVAYCSCDPVTLARDLRELRTQGFSIEQIRVFDLFPGTHHFETLVWLGAAR